VTTVISPAVHMRAGKRAELLAAHRQWAAAAQPAQGRGWVPPEAAAAAADHAERHASWNCSMCTLLNGPLAGQCEACGASRPSGGSRSGSSSSSVSTPGSSGGGAAAVANAAADVQLAQDSLLADAGANGKQQKVKAKKIPKFERLRVTGRDSAAMAHWMDAAGVQKKNPLNAWGASSSSSGARMPQAPPQPKQASVWGGGGVAHRDVAAKQAWGK